MRLPACVVLPALFVFTSSCKPRRGADAPVKSAGSQEAPASDPGATRKLPVKTVDWGKPVEKKLYAAKSVFNQAAPELKVQEWISEKPDKEGRFVLIDFWATWCGPCRKLIPELNGIAEEFRDDLVVIGLSEETAEKVRGMREPSIRYFSAVDPGQVTKKELGVSGIPHVLLVDPAGRVCYQGFPLDDVDPLNAEKIRAIISRYKAVP